MNGGIIDNIVAAAANEFGVTQEDILSPRKSLSIANARAVLFYIMRHRLGMSYPKIGQAFNRHHTTALLAIRRVGRSNALIEHAANVARVIDNQCAVTGVA